MLSRAVRGAVKKIHSLRTCPLRGGGDGGQNPCPIRKCNFFWEGGKIYMKKKTNINICSCVCEGLGGGGLKVLTFLLRIQVFFKGSPEECHIVAEDTRKS